MGQPCHLHSQEARESAQPWGRSRPAARGLASSRPSRSTPRPLILSGASHLANVRLLLRSHVNQGNGEVPLLLFHTYTQRAGPACARITHDSASVRLRSEACRAGAAAAISSAIRSPLSKPNAHHDQLHRSRSVGRKAGAQAGADSGGTAAAGLSCRDHTRCALSH